MKYLTWAEISKQNLAYNFSTLQKMAGQDTTLAPCIKANAYGHGIVSVTKELIRDGARWFCVNSIEEAILLRQEKIKANLLIIGYVQKSDLDKVIKTNSRIFVSNKNILDELDNLARKNKTTIQIHIKVDTGMSRQGVLVSEFDNFYKYALTKKNIEIEGVATHYATADEPGNKIFEQQKNRFKKIYDKYRNKIKYWHAANSATLLLGENNGFNFARPGISIYGYYPSEEVKKICERKKIILKPVLTLKTKVAQVKEIAQGEIVSYGATWQARTKTKIAIIPAGYYDGLPRALSNKAEILIRGQKAKIIGRVCMDIMVADISKIKDAKSEDEVAIIGEQGIKKITADDIAKQAQTINYEILTNIRETMPKIFI